MTAEPAKLVLNNLIVDQLRSGSASAVERLVLFGVRPDFMIDRVDANSSVVDLDINAETTRRSAWFWSHQSPSPEGAAAWWNLLDRQLSSASPLERLALLSERFKETCQAGLELSHSEALLFTWDRMLRWAEPHGWSRQIMMAYATRAIAHLGDVAVPGLKALSSAGLIVPNDWSLPSRRSYPSDPMTVAVSDNRCKLVEALLDLGCDASIQDGTPILTVAWSRFRQELAKSDFHVDGMASASAMVEYLLSRGLDWTVPCGMTGTTRTVSEDAVATMPFLVTKKKWERLAHHIEKASLEDNTPPGVVKTSHRPRL